MIEEKTINIRCEAAEYIQLDDLTPLQGDLKSITKENFNKLKQSLITDGIPLGFHTWKDNNKIHIVDGHTRRLALLALRDEGYHIPALPCNPVVAKNKKEAAKVVLISNSRYAGMSQESISDFMIDFELDLSDLDNLDIPDLNMDDFELDSEDSDREEIESVKLVDKFIIPPFSYIDTRQDYFMKRVDAWKELGIQSGNGRDDELTFRSGDDFMGKENEKRGTTSIFNPAIAEICYKWLSPKMGIILDPFSGGSVRGIVASHCDRKYIGIDIRKEQIESNNDQMNIAGLIKPSWIQGDSMDIVTICKKNNIENVDFIFSCPPYADLEVYSDNPKDISNMKYDEFKKAYFEIIKNTCSLLKQNRFACFVVGEVRDKKGNYYNFVSDTIQAFRDAGLEYYNEIILINQSGTGALRANKQFTATRKVVKMHQNILVFVKGDPKQATIDCGDVDVELGENVE